MSPQPGPSGGLLLRDIHLPAPPRWWPPAPGWWMLIGLLLLGAGLLSWWYYRRRQHGSQLARVLAEVDRLLADYRRTADSAMLAAELHQLLRRASRWLDRTADRQQGMAWRATLASVGIDEASLTQLQALEMQLYRTGHTLDVEASAAAVRRWLQLAWRRRSAVKLIGTP